MIISEGVTIEIDGENTKPSYVYAFIDRQPTVRLDENDIRARETLCIRDELDNVFATVSLRMANEHREEYWLDGEDEENVVNIVQSEFGNSVIN